MTDPQTYTEMSSAKYKKNGCRFRTPVTLLTACLGPVLMFIFGTWAESLECFSELNSMRSSSVPAEQLNYGSLGVTLKQLGLLTIVPGKHSPTEMTEKQAPSSPVGIFQKKRRPSEWAYAPAQKNVFVNRFPLQLKLENPPPGWPILSVQIQNEDLYDHDRGIVANPEQRGRTWERPGIVTYIENGSLRYQNWAGIRLHGGASRKTGRNFRAYFRDCYGLSSLPAASVFPESRLALRRLVIREDAQQKHFFISCMAFDIARRIGCMVPAAKPAIFYLNGHRMGVYFLAEHLSRTQWEPYFAGKEFAFCVYKGQTSPRGRQLYGQLHYWLENAPEPLKLSEVKQYVDVNNLTRYVISVAFCGTTDGFQGIAALDISTPEAKWFWINWDMDHSFIDVYPEGVTRKPWEQEGMELILENGDIRAMLFQRLITEDPEYLRFFRKTLEDVFDNRLTKAFFENRIEYYEYLAKTCPTTSDSLELIREFLERRPRIIKTQAEQLITALENRRQKTHASHRKTP